MRAIVVYESMYGNTRHVAEAVGRGLEASAQVRVAPVSTIEGIDPGAYNFVVVGGPTHRHGMSRQSTRRLAADNAAASSGDLTMEPASLPEGLRDWLGSLSGMSQRAAAFDTRLDGSPLLTGRASKGIAKLLVNAGFDLVAEPESFLVDEGHHLLAGEEERAQAWGAALL
jgi:Flavodoxin domain